MELCMCFSKNISELNGWGVVLCLRSRCSQTGRPTAAAPARNQGAKKPILESPLSHREILPQTFVERPAGVHQEVLETRTARLRAERFDVRVNAAAILVARIFRRDFERVRGVFHVDQEDRLL